MDPYIARALRGNPIAEEIKLILALNHTRRNKPNRTKKIITTLLPRSILLNCENVKRVVCPAEVDDPDPRLLRLQTRHNKAAFLFHVELVNGLIIMLNFHTNTILKAVERIVANPTSRLPKRVYRSAPEVSPQRLLASPTLSESPTISYSGSTPPSSRRRRPVSLSRSPAGRKKRTSPSPSPSLEEDEWSLLSFAFGDESIETFELEKDKMHLVPESTITMFDEESISSIDRTYQREFFDMIKEFDESGPGDVDVSGIGTPGEPKPFYFNYSTPVRGRRVLFEERLRDLPPDEELMKLSASELMKDAQKRKPQRALVPLIQSPQRKIIRRVLQVPESGFSGVPQSTPRVPQSEAPPTTPRRSIGSEESYQVLSPVLHPESLIRPPLPVTPAIVEHEPFQVYHDSEGQQVPSPAPTAAPVVQAPPAAELIDDFAVRLRHQIAESPRVEQRTRKTPRVSAEEKEIQAQDRAQRQLNLFHTRSKGWFRMTKQKWLRKMQSTWKTKKRAQEVATRTPEEPVRQVSEWVRRDRPVPTLRDRRWMTHNKWNLDISEEVMIDILGGRLEAPRGEEEARRSMDEEQARLEAGEAVAAPVWEDDTTVTEEEVEELLQRAYEWRDYLPLPFEPSLPLQQQMAQAGLVAVRDDSADMMDEQFLRLCLGALDWDQDRNNWFLNNPNFDPNGDDERLFEGTLSIAPDALPRTDEEEFSMPFPAPLVSASAMFRWPDWRSRLRGAEDLEQPQLPPPPPLPPTLPDFTLPMTIEDLFELNRVQEAMASDAAAASTSSATAGTAQMAMARSDVSIGGYSLQALNFLGSDPHVIDSFIKSIHQIFIPEEPLEIVRLGECMGVKTSFIGRPVSSVSRPSTLALDSATGPVEEQGPALPLELTVADTTVVQAAVEEAAPPPAMEMLIPLEPVPEELPPLRDPIELRPREDLPPPIVDEPPSPRRRRRRRRPRVPPPPEPVEPGEPMDVVEHPIVEQPVEEPMELLAEAVPEEEEHYWSEAGVLRLISQQQTQLQHVLRFSDLCPPGNARREAASLFQRLINLYARKRVELWQEDLTGDPTQLFIRGLDATLE